MAEHVIKPLAPETWDAYAALIEKHNGVWGGCWCSWFHPDTPENPKKQLGGAAFKRRKQCDAEIPDPAPYRITCLFVDRDHRRSGGVAGTKISSSFLHNATRTMFESEGFEYLRPLRTKKALMRKTVAAT